MKRLYHLAAIAAILTGALLTSSCKKDKEPETGFDIENIVFMNENDEVVMGGETIDADGNTHEYVLVNTETMDMFTGKAKWTVTANGQSVCKDASAEKTGSEYKGEEYSENTYEWYVRVFPNSIELYANDQVAFSIIAKDAKGKSLTLNIESI
ncbi:MAG: hypothetical protein K6E61_01160 [Bacteroidales bacterium]|nr:hypothetical protein [Bacteroidales bacterium]